MRESQQLAARVVARVLAGRSLAEALPQALNRRGALTPQERGRVQDLCYGTLRHYGALAAVLGRLVPRAPGAPVRCLLLVALYQLVHTRAAPHAVVDQAVCAAQRIERGGAKGLVNAVLRNFLRQRESLLSASAASDEGRYSHPRWWVERLRHQYPEAFSSLLDSDNLHPPMALRVNRRAISRDEYLDRLTAAGLHAGAASESGILLERPVAVEALAGFGDGLVSVQDLGAQWAAPFLDAGDGMRVLDACAAPGGKTAHLLERADLDLLALDHDRARLARVEQNLQRLKLTAQLKCADAGDVCAWWDGRPFQRILADVPCSGSGVARRHPDIKWLRRESDIAQFAREQSRLLDALWQTLDLGGKLLYVTCSVFAEENQGVIAAFLDRHHDARSSPLPGRREASWQLVPEPTHDGFFYALVAKA